MPGRNLKHKPLVEAIVELRWELKPVGPSGADLAVDPHFDITLGRFFDQVSNDYPFPERLPAADIPPSMVPHQVRQRFRKAADAWPLVQLGHGILTVNETEGYDWQPFRDNVVRAIERLYKAHPVPSAIKPQSLILRYIDAFPFDYTKNNSFEFLHEKLKLSTAPPDSFFKKHKVNAAPTTFLWRSTFKCEAPKGNIALQLATGHSNNAPAIIMETFLESKGSDVPRIPDDIGKWADSAHNIATDWFFDLIEGDLHASFAGA